MVLEAPKSDFYQLLLDEHRMFLQILGEIAEALAARTEPVEIMAGTLSRLRPLLEQHFINEERGGFFAEALTEAPHLTERAAALAEQHSRLIELLAKIDTRPESQDSVNDWWTQANEHFQEFYAELLIHEHQEDALLQEAYIRDIGSNH